MFVAVESPADLEPDRLELQHEIARDGAIWAIRPKGRADLTEAMVIGAGRDAGLTDIKIARISETHTGDEVRDPGCAAVRGQTLFGVRPRPQAASASESRAW